MTASLFAANYELRHIAAEDVIFTDPVTGADASLAEQGECHIDAAMVARIIPPLPFVISTTASTTYSASCGKKHIDNCEDQIIEYRKQFNAGRIYCEDNGDKGYLAKDLRRRGERSVSYHESTNKFLKITSYLKSVWNDVVFVAGTDPEYINQICDYNENAEHDDAPDSAASIVRRFWKNKT